jgi:hypothetical protein
MDRQPHESSKRLVRIDLERRRVWIGGQRVHHGVTGIALASLAITGLVARRLTARGGIEWALVGTAMIAHDWHDRAVWFERGPGSQE